MKEENKKVIIFFSLVILGTIAILYWSVTTNWGVQIDDTNNNIFTTDVYSFDDSIIFIMNARNVIVESGFCCYINGEEINSSCYIVYHETNDTYAQKTFIKVFHDSQGMNFTDGQIVQVWAIYSSPDWDFDFYSMDICNSCMKINYGWYPYSCY